MCEAEKTSLVLLQAQYTNDKEMEYKMFFKNHIGEKRKKLPGIYCNFFMNTQLLNSPRKQACSQILSIIKRNFTFNIT